MTGVRFGICTDQNQPFDVLVDRWRLFEQLGFDSVWDCDHFNQPSRPEGPYYEGWTLLAALAARTERIRVGVLVSSNTFRHPALLAQQAVTVDHVSGGRLELGIGAGWYVGEHERFGVEFPDPGERVARFREAIEIIDALMTQDLVSFDGRHYSLKEAAVRPAPLQRPRPPFTLGAHRTRMLQICAEFADAWNSFGTVEEIAERNAILDAHCTDLGRPPSAIRRSLYCWSAMMPQQGMPDPWSSRDAFDEVIGRYTEVGVNEFIIDQPRPDQQGVLEAVASEALARWRAEPAG